MTGIANHAGAKDVISAGLSEYVAPLAPCLVCSKETVEDKEPGWRICSSQECRDKHPLNGRRYEGVSAEKLASFVAKARRLELAEAKLRQIGELSAAHSEAIRKLLA